MHRQIVVLLLSAIMLNSLHVFADESKLRIGNITFGSKFKGIPRVVSKMLNPEADPPKSLIDELPLFGSFVIQLSEDTSGILPLNVSTGVAQLYTPKTRRIWGVIFETNKVCLPDKYSEELFNRIIHLYGEVKKSSGKGSKKTKKTDERSSFGIGFLGASMVEFLEEVEKYNHGKMRNDGILKTRQGELLVVIFSVPIDKIAAKTNMKNKKYRLKIAYFDLPTFRTACQELETLRKESQ